MSNPNLPLLVDAAEKLRPFLKEIVFVGGITLGLLITDLAAAPIRGTTDVDVIAEILTYMDYCVFSERLRGAAFTEDMGESGEQPLACRWHNGELTLDVLALRVEVLGYTNLWYDSALSNAMSMTLPGGASIRVITAPFFLGTKMEAFRGRGQLDYQASHDIEDFVAVIDGRPSLLQEISSSPADLRAYLAEAAQRLLNEERFMDVLPGFVIEEDRVPIINDRLKAIASIDTHLR